MRNLKVWLSVRDEGASDRRQEFENEGCMLTINYDAKGEVNGEK
ncbi:hypothetical protein [Agriterribacter sp.]|nr:hypothetical protein [Agriterribacter sp.]HTN09177.1 hypothetical protein [Agriterribacter sp.]